MRLFKAPKIPYERLEAMYAELASQYCVLRDAKTQPAPNDTPWQQRFTMLDKENTTLHKDYVVVTRENAELKIQVAALTKLLEQKFS